MVYFDIEVVVAWALKFGILYIYQYAINTLSVKFCIFLPSKSIPENNQFDTYNLFLLRAIKLGYCS